MAFSRGALGPAKTIQTPMEIAWQTTPSNHSAGSPPNIQEAVFFEQRRSDGRILFVLATVIANDAEQSRWLRFMEFALAKNPNLQGLAPADLLRRLHGYLATIFRRNPGHWGAVHATVLLVDPVNRFWRAYRAGEPLPMFARELGGWSSLPTLAGPRLGVPGSGAMVGATADEIFPVNPEQGDVQMVSGDAMTLVSRGLYDAPAHNRPPRRFGSSPDGLLSSLNILSATSSASSIAAAASSALVSFRGPAGLDNDGTILVLKLD
ncbi:MAG: SpoIIE family protein phosphatase [Pirellulales bacterium]